MNNDTNIQNDEIDLRELFLTIKQNINYLIYITATITILAALYAFLATPWFEAKAILEIGSYKEDNKNIPLNDTNKLVKRLSIVYIDVLKSDIDRDAFITSINTIKKNDSFIEIVALAKTNDKAKIEINKIIDKINKTDANKILEVKQKLQSKISQADRNLFNAKEFSLNEIKDKLKYEKNVHLKQLENQMSVIKLNIASLIKDRSYLQNKVVKKTNDTSLKAISIMQISSINNQLSDLRLQNIEVQEKIDSIVNVVINDLKRDKEIIEKDTIVKLEEDKKIAQFAMSDYNFKNSELVGEIIVKSTATKPKRKLIIIVAFITGLMLSIFIIFFMNFIRNMKEMK